MIARAEGVRFDLERVEQTFLSAKKSASDPVSGHETHSCLPRWRGRINSGRKTMRRA